MTDREETDEMRHRDDAGRWLPGHGQPGPGRPRGPEFRRVVAERLHANGGSLDAVLFEVFEALRAAAAAGDVPAARLLLDRLCPDEKGAAAGRDLEQLLAETARGLTDDERAERVAELLRTTAGRRGRLPIGPVSLTVTTGVTPQSDATTSRTSYGDPFAVGAPPSPAAPGTVAMAAADVARGVGTFTQNRTS